MMNTGNYDLKSELQAQAQLQPAKDTGVKLTKDMSIPDMVRAMAPELKKALPSVMSPERFTRIALSALNNTPQLKQCTPRVTPKFCVKSNECRNRAEFVWGGSGLTVCRLCLQHNAGGDGCQGRRSRSFNP